MKPVHHRDPERITPTQVRLGEIARAIRDRMADPLGTVNVLDLVLEAYELGRKDGSR